MNHAMHSIDSPFADDRDGDGPGPKKKAVKTADKKTYNKVKNATKSLNEIVSTSDDALSLALDFKGNSLFNKTMSPFSRTLGTLNKGFSFGMGVFDTVDYFKGNISGVRLGINLTSYATPIVVGSEFGGLAGFLSGLAFTAGEMWYNIFVNQINPILTRVNTSNPYWIYNYR